MNRTLQPEIQELVQFNILPPVRTVMPNGVPLTIINAGEQDVVRVDILFGGGRWQQSQKLQALFANRMLREGSRKYTAAEIAEKLDYYGAWLELSSSAEYAYITLYSLNKYFAETLDVLESIIKEPLFPEKELGTVIEDVYKRQLINSVRYRLFYITVRITGYADRYIFRFHSGERLNSPNSAIIFSALSISSGESTPDMDLRFL